jgi:cysteine desulfurase/selenocysteine lyase
MTEATTIQKGLDVNAIRRQFPALDREVKGRPLVYLDNAANFAKPQW